jgi:hypothetical protein
VLLPLTFALVIRTAALTAALTAASLVDVGRALPLRRHRDGSHSFERDSPKAAGETVGRQVRERAIEPSL